MKKSYIKYFIKEITILLIALGVLIFAFTAIPAAAESQWASTTIHYTVDDSYMVYIPESIAVGEEVEISAMDMNISSDKKVVVSFGMFDTDDSIYLHNTDDYDRTIEVCFTNSDGNVIRSNRPRIGTFSSGDTTPIRFSSYVKAVEDAKAGDYSGTVTFDIFCE